MITQCCFCKKPIQGYGNDPYPVNRDWHARCCDECNATKVIAARLDEMFGGRKDEGNN
jgi:hypothetical protein